MLNNPKNPEEQHDPIFVLNPFTGERIDVLPFLFYLNDWEDDNPLHAAKEVDNHIRFIALQPKLMKEHKYAVQDNLAHLYALRDMFESTTIIKNIQCPRNG